MNNKFTLNGKEYNAREFDINLVCDLGDMGVDILGGNMGQAQLLPLLRAYLACCMHTTLAVAGTELQNHLTNGGNLDEVTNAMSSAMDNSDFFRAISTTEKKSNTTTRKKAKTELTTVQ